MSHSAHLLALASTFFFSKNLRISITTNYYKSCNGTKQEANRWALVLSVTHRGGKNNTDVEFATNYSDSAHIWAYALRKARSSFCTICAGDNVAFLAAGYSICNHMKTSWAIFIMIFFFLLRYRDPGLFPKHPNAQI